MAISDFTKSEIERYSNLNGKQVDVIYNGVEQLDGTKAVRPEFVKGDKPFFFTIGQIREKKNFHVLLPMMKHFPDRELYIAGGKVTEYADVIEQQIKDLGLTNVHLVGTVSNEERTWLYANCEAFLFPSLFEGFGLPVIEAMQFGKPVFSSRETSLHEISGNHAFFWENFGPETMATTVKEGLNTFNNTPNMSDNNRKYAYSFSYQRHIEQYLDVYL